MQAWCNSSQPQYASSVPPKCRQSAALSQVSPCLFDIFSCSGEAVMEKPLWSKGGRDPRCLAAGSSSAQLLWAQPGRPFRPRSGQRGDRKAGWFCFAKLQLRMWVWETASISNSEWAPVSSESESLVRGSHVSHSAFARAVQNIFIYNKFGYSEPLGERNMIPTSYWMKLSNPIDFVSWFRLSFSGEACIVSKGRFSAL